MTNSPVAEPPVHDIHFFKMKSVVRLKFASALANQKHLRLDARTAWFVDNNMKDRQEAYIRKAVEWLHANCLGEFDYRVEETYLNFPTNKLHPQQPDYYVAHAIRHFVRFERSEDVLRFKLSC